MEEFDLNQEEISTSLNKGCRRWDVKDYKNNKNSYCVVQEAHLDENYFIDSQTGGTLERTDQLGYTKLAMTILRTWQMNSGCSRLKCSNS